MNMNSSVRKKGSHCDRCIMVLHYHFKLHFPNDKWCWASFHMLICYLWIFFGKVSAQFWSILNIGLFSYCWVLTVIFIYTFLKRFYLFIFRQRGREGEREGEKHQCVVASHTPTTGDPARNPGMCPDWESNQQLFGSQAGAQSTEPLQPGLSYLNILFMSSLWYLFHFYENIVSCQYFLSVYNLSFQSFNRVFYRTEIFNFNKVQYIDFYFLGSCCSWWCLSKTPLPNPKSWIFAPRSFVILHFTLGSIIHFELNFMRSEDCFKITALLR